MRAATDHTEATQRPHQPPTEPTHPQDHPEASTPRTAAPVGIPCPVCTAERPPLLVLVIDQPDRVDPDADRSAPVGMVNAHTTARIITPEALPPGVILGILQRTYRWYATQPLQCAPTGSDSAADLTRQDHTA